MTMISNTNLQYHQVGNFIHVLIKEAGVKPEELNVQIQKRRLTIILTKGKNRLTLFEGLLFDSVDVGNSRTKINEDHILIKLRKLDETIDWSQLQLSGTSSEPPQNSRNSISSLQRAQQSSWVSPESSPTHPSNNWSPKEKIAAVNPKEFVKEGVDSFQTSISSLVSAVNKTIHELGEEKRETVSKSISDPEEEKRDVVPIEMSA